MWSALAQCKSWSCHHGMLMVGCTLSYLSLTLLFAWLTLNVLFFSFARPLVEIYKGLNLPPQVSSYLLLLLWVREFYPLEMSQARLTLIVDVPILLYPHHQSLTPSWCAIALLFRRPTASCGYCRINNFCNSKWVYFLTLGNTVINQQIYEASISGRPIWNWRPYRIFVRHYHSLVKSLSSTAAEGSLRIYGTRLSVLGHLTQSQNTQKSWAVDKSQEKALNTKCALLKALLSFL